MIASAILIAALFFPSAALSAEKPKLKDKDIAQAIETDLAIDDGVRAAHRVDVTSEEGIVTLSGTVDNLLAKDRSEKVAERIRGVKAVVNRVRVNTPNIADGRLKNSVEVALALDAATDAYELNVTARNGKVTLAGQ